ncbi:MAG: hypothetical protein PHV74_02930 [Dehalococcoidia bacterium]|nr:hypothetical protein [Dehalococcoidia bacterium]
MERTDATSLIRPVWWKTNPFPLCYGYFTAIVTIEVETVVRGPEWGVGLYFALLFGLALGATALDPHPFHRIYTALELIPLMRIAALALPLPEFTEASRYAIVAVPVFAGIIGVSRILRLRADEIGLTARAMPEQILVALTGVAFGAVAYLILKPESQIAQLTVAQAMFPSLVFVAFLGFGQELAYRGVMQHVARSFGSWGWVYIAGIFAAVQIQYESALYCLLMLPMALWFGWIVKRTESIMGVSIGSGLFYISLYLLFPNIW